MYFTPTQQSKAECNLKPNYTLAREKGKKEGQCSKATNIFGVPLITSLLHLSALLQSFTSMAVSVATKLIWCSTPKCSDIHVF